MSDLLLEARDLVKDYHDGERTLRVLRGLDFALRPGETVAIMGQSGSGKSTLLNLLCMLDRPTDGSIRLDGDELVEMPSWRLNQVRLHRIGLVFQFHHLLHEFRAWENVAMPAFVARQPRAAAKRRAYELLDQVGLADRANHIPSKLSGGEQQRVALARSLMNDPAVVLADEPTGNLDVRTGEKVVELLWDETKSQGRSLVIVTHEKSIADNADRILRLEDGKLHTA